MQLLNNHSIVNKNITTQDMKCISEIYGMPLKEKEARFLIDLYKEQNFQDDYLSPN